MIRGSRAQAKGAQIMKMLLAISAVAGLKQKGCEKQIKQTQDEPQWIVAQRLLSALTIPGFS